MTYADFIRRFLGLLTEDSYNPETLDILGKAVDGMCTGYVAYIFFLILQNSF